MKNMKQFFVQGLPATQGSKRPLRNQYTGKIVCVDSCKRLKPWRQDVREAALCHVERGEALHEGPVHLHLVFYLPRPKGDYGSGKNAGILKGSAPRHHLKKPDLTKLSRAVEDAMKGVMWKDDSQVWRQDYEKRYVGDGALQPPGVAITIMFG